VDLLQQIVKLMAANDLNTVDVRDGDKRVILKRGAHVVAGTPMVSYASVPAHSAPPPAAAASAAAPSDVDADAGLTAIKSPMVGTFYAASTPEAKPLVSVGAKVDEETDVCIIEAMKVFNNIKAECPRHHRQSPRHQRPNRRIRPDALSRQALIKGHAMTERRELRFSTPDDIAHRTSSTCAKATRASANGRSRKSAGT